jgi:hypothetical protein
VVSDDDIAELAAAGLAGLEVDHRENTAAGKESIRRLAVRHDLVLTGSSDYHGTGKPNRLGENTTAEEVVQAIIDRGSGSSPIYGTSASTAS